MKRQLLEAEQARHGCRCPPELGCRGDLCARLDDQAIRGKAGEERLHGRPVPSVAERCQGGVPFVVSVADVADGTQEPGRRLYLDGAARQPAAQPVAGQRPWPDAAGNEIGFTRGSKRKTKVEACSAAAGIASAVDLAASSPQYIRVDLGLFSLENLVPHDSEEVPLGNAVLPTDLAAVHTSAMQLPPRLESLVLKSGLHLGLMPEPDRALVLALAACAVEFNRPMREDEVNRRLVGWLADVGAMVKTDHVELRRWLVDGDYVARDSWGHAYLRGPAQLERARVLLGTTDAAALASAVRAARVAAQSARVARRQDFERRRPVLVG